MFTTSFAGHAAGLFMDQPARAKGRAEEDMLTSCCASTAAATTRCQHYCTTLLHMSIASALMCDADT